MAVKVIVDVEQEVEEGAEVKFNLRRSQVAIPNLTDGFVFVLTALIYQQFEHRISDFYS